MYQRKFRDNDIVYVNGDGKCCLGRVVDCQEYISFRPDYLIESYDGISFWIDEVFVRDAEPEEEFEINDINMIM